MAEQTVHDVVKEEQLMGTTVPISESATPISSSAVAGNGLAIPSTNNVPATTNSKYADETVTAKPGQEVERSRAGNSTVLDGNVRDATLAVNEVTAGSLVGADLSGGSDTDTSVLEVVEPGKDQVGHVRSNSIKKPATFKSVSVTKSFLAKSVAGSPAVKGLPDSRGILPTNTSGLGQGSARPRLVAKSGSSGLTPRSMSTANGGSGGPDASKVWNKNRPVAPPPPKHFTDEELKQQYGIHMATRLQTDENSKESKWADIDDDEDDWAPETVEWMDGTKSSSVVPTETAPVATPVEDVQPVPVPPVKVEPVKQPSTIMPRPSSTSGTKTILKPGGHSQVMAGPLKVVNGLVAKGLTDKPTLVAKASAPVPVKSPWATLPPVDKVPPVAPPVQPPQQSRFSHDPHNFDSLPPLSAAKEIAADDFNRVWREDQSGRTLFDSKSGRYEPVPDARRGSFRDQGFRQPAVLQRPSNDGVKGGPAEPSAAFQTSRNSGELGWGRRRASSSLSGGSGSLARRMSVNRIVDAGPQPTFDSNGEYIAPRQRRESSSQTQPGVDLSEEPQAVQQASQAGISHTQSENRVYTSPTIPRWTRTAAAVNNPQLTNGQTRHQSSLNGDEAVSAEDNSQVVTSPSEPSEDPIARQQRLMREKIERARQAKMKQIEEEKRETDARAERLRLKMESLKSTSPETQQTPLPPATIEALSKVAGTAKEEQLGEGRPNTQPFSHQTLSPSANSNSLQSSSLSPSKPPIPSQDGSVTQFGLMKVHQPQTVKRATQDFTFPPRPADQPQTSPHGFPQPYPPQQAAQQSSPSPHRSPQRPYLPPSPNNMSRDKSTSSGPTGAQAWQQAAARFGSVPNKDVNIWGSSTGGLGNGVLFQQNVGTLGNDEASSTKDVRLGEASSNHQSSAHTAQTDEEARKNKQKEAREAAYQRKFGPKIAEIAERERLTTGSHIFTSVRPGLDGEPPEVVTFTTWREGYGPRLAWGLPWPNDERGEPMTFSIHNSKTGVTTYPFLEPEKRQKDHEQRYANLTADLMLVESSKDSRQSRYFDKEGKLSDGQTLFRDVEGPPPDALSYALHRTSTGSAMPNVKLPPPKPIVKLPTRLSNGSLLQKKIRTTAATPVSGPKQPPTQQPEIMSKLNNLLGKAPEPVDPNIVPELPGWLPPHLRKRVRYAPVAPEVTSKPIFDDDATLSRDETFFPRIKLPPRAYTGEAFVPDFGGPLYDKVSNEAVKSAMTKTRAEEDFLEDREFGSVPVVNLPKVAPANTHVHQTLPKYANSRFGRPSVDAVTVNTSASPVEVLPTLQGVPIVIRFPGMTSSKAVSMPFKPIPNTSIAGNGSSNDQRGFSGSSRDARGRDVRGGRRPFGQGATRGPVSSRPSNFRTSAPGTPNVDVRQADSAFSPVRAHNQRPNRGGARGGRGRGSFGQGPSNVSST